MAFVASSTGNSVIGNSHMLVILEETGKIRSGTAGSSAFNDRGVSRQGAHGVGIFNIGCENIGDGRSRGIVLSSVVVVVVIGQSVVIGDGNNK